MLEVYSSILWIQCILKKGTASCQYNGLYPYFDQCALTRPLWAIAQ